MHCSYQAKKTLKLWDLLQQVLYTWPVHVSASFNTFLWPCGRLHISVQPLHLCKINSQKLAKWNQIKTELSICLNPMEILCPQNLKTYCMMCTQHEGLLKSCSDGSLTLSIATFTETLFTVSGHTCQKFTFSRDEKKLKPNKILF